MLLMYETRQRHPIPPSVNTEHKPVSLAIIVSKHVGLPMAVAS